MSDFLHLVCPNCQAINRVPSSRLNQHPNCGRCHQPIFNGKPLPLTADTFQRQVLENDIPVLVDFWAPWCGPCRTMAPAFEKAAGILEPSIRLAKVDTDSEPSLGNQYGIRSIPTLILFKNGKEQARQAGAMGAQDIVSWARTRE